MADEVVNATHQPPQIQAGQDMPDGQQIDPGAPGEVESGQPAEGSVSFAPSDPGQYVLPELADPSLGEALRQGAFDTGLSVSEVEILSEQLAAAESLTEAACDAELARMYGSPMAVENVLMTVVQAFGPELAKYGKVLDETGLGNSPQLIGMLFQSAQRKLGRY